MRTLDILGFVEGNGDQTPAVRVGAIVPLFLMQRMTKDRILCMAKKWLALRISKSHPSAWVHSKMNWHCKGPSAFNVDGISPFDRIFLFSPCGDWRGPFGDLGDQNRVINCTGPGIPSWCMSSRWTHRFSPAVFWSWF
jgi:hypothetical protein